MSQEIQYQRETQQCVCGTWNNLGRARCRKCYHIMPQDGWFNPEGPKTKAELHRDLAGYIENEGFDYALRSYTSPEYQNCDRIDPELAMMWRDYIDLAKRIEARVGTK